LVNLDLLPHADILCTSLTKYAASGGDVMAGLLVVNETREDAQRLINEVKKTIEPLYAKDADVLAHQIIKQVEVVEKMCRSAELISQRLLTHPAVASVRTAETVRTKENYKKIKRTGAGAGALITIELKKK
jgi:cystathionine gamma-synthase